MWCTLGFRVQGWCRGLLVLVVVVVVVNVVVVVVGVVVVVVDVVFVVVVLVGRHCRPVSWREHRPPHLWAGEVVGGVRGWGVSGA